MENIPLERPQNPVENDILDNGLDNNASPLRHEDIICDEATLGQASQQPQHQVSEPMEFSSFIPPNGGKEAWLLVAAGFAAYFNNWYSLPGVNDTEDLNISKGA